MNSLNKLADVPRGNTVAGVNRAIIERLSTLNEDLAGKIVFDVPCGAGDFLRALKDFYPQAETVGADINAPLKIDFDRFIQFDARRNVSIELEKRARVITCISGVMEFDNTLAFFEMLRQQNLDEQGIFIVTNDNLLTVRDRFLYLLFGRYRQYRLFIGDDRPTWKTLSTANLLRILSESGFEPFEIRYVPIKTAEWLWLPAAILIYLFQTLYFCLAETEMSYAEKISRYPFRSLLSRHYIIFCRAKR